MMRRWQTPIAYRREKSMESAGGKMGEKMARWTPHHSFKWTGWSWRPRDTWMAVGSRGVIWRVGPEAQLSRTLAINKGGIGGPATSATVSPFNQTGAHQPTDPRRFFLAVGPAGSAFQRRRYNLADLGKWVPDTWMARGVLVVGKDGMMGGLGEGGPTAVPIFRFFYGTLMLLPFRCR